MQRSAAGSVTCTICTWFADEDVNLVAKSETGGWGDHTTLEQGTFA